MAMLNKIRLVLSMGFLLCFSVLYAQDEKPKVTIEVKEFKICDNKLSFRLIICNNEEEGLTIFKPYTESICSGIFKLYLINSQSNKKYEIFPCTEIDDVGNIILNEMNSIYIDRNEGFIKDYIFNINDISPYLIRGNYLFFLEFNLKDILFDTIFKNVLKENLTSNKIEIVY